MATDSLGRGTLPPPDFVRLSQPHAGNLALLSNAATAFVRFPVGSWESTCEPNANPPERRPAGDGPRSGARQAARVKRRPPPPYFVGVGVGVGAGPGSVSPAAGAAAGAGVSPSATSRATSAASGVDIAPG